MSSTIQDVLPPNFLKDKVILITGASQGIGQISAFAFARAGAKVVLNARRLEPIHKHVAAIEADGGEAIAIQGDVADPASVKTLIDEIMSRYGRLDGAFNNAGVEQTPALLADMSIEDFDNTNAVKARGTFLCLKYEIPAMIKSGGGSIVNAGSVVSERAIPAYPAPAVTQGAIPGLTRVAAAGYGRNNIRVNMLYIGGVRTPERAVHVTAEMLEREKTFCPLGRSGRGEEIAAVAGWMLSNYSSYVTGACVPVDGGYLAGMVPG
jgi:NAD(P)-dependent dehydrogenase (short-subunit alcohol dehydrogenase family)